MAIDTELLESLKELREEVCQRCAHQHLDGAMCMPNTTPCGLELPLSQLVQAMEQSTHGTLMLSLPQVEPSPDHCPCPPDVLARFATEACQAIEEHRKQRERLLDTWNDG